jgi:AraC-like DNA-binding protein
MKAYWDFPRNISSVRILVGLGVDHGLSVAQCLAGAGIRPERLDLPDAEVEAEQELTVIRNLLRELGNDLPLGMEAGARYHPTTYGVWGFAILSSPTIRSAVEVGLRYLRLTSIFSKISVVETPDEAQIIADDEELPADVRGFLVERDGATLMSLQRDVLPLPMPPPLTRLELKGLAPPYVERIESLFGISPLFNQPINRLGISAELVNWRLPQGDLSAFTRCEAECQRLLERRQLRAGTAGKVRDRLLANPRNMPTMDVLADELAMTARTLRRHLAAEGTDYESLVDEVRAALAEELLKTTDLSVEEIAERLGYSEPSCFTRAFKRWKDMPPRKFRDSPTPV